MILPCGCWADNELPKSRIAPNVIMNAGLKYLNIIVKLFVFNYEGTKKYTYIKCAM